MKSGLVHVVLVRPVAAKTSPELNPPFASFTVQNVSLRGYQELAIRYGQILVGIGLILCILTICLGHFILKDGTLELTEREINIEVGRFPEKLSKGFVMGVGYVWDPEEEEAIVARAKARVSPEAL